MYNSLSELLLSNIGHCSNFVFYYKIGTILGDRLYSRAVFKIINLIPLKFYIPILCIVPDHRSIKGYWFWHSSFNNIIMQDFFNTKYVQNFLDFFFQIVFCFRFMVVWFASIFHFSYVCFLKWVIKFEAYFLNFFYQNQLFFVEFIDSKPTRRTQILKIKC